MREIAALIAEHCPNGVETRPLGDVIDYEQPTKYLVASKKYDDAFRTPVLTAGKTFLLGYTDETDGVCEASPAEPVIIFDDFTTAAKWVDFPFKAKSSAMKMLRPCRGLEIDFKYVWHAMQCLPFEATTHARHWISVYSKFEIPLPPLPVQRAIAEALSTMEALHESLRSEEEARHQQFTHYRNALTSPQEGIDLTLRDVGSVAMCKRVFKEQTTESGDVPFFKIGTFGGRPDAYITREIFEDYRNRFKFPGKGAVLLSAAGTIGRSVVYDGADAYFQDSNIVWLEHDGSKVSNEYFEFWYQSVRWRTADGGTIKRLYNDLILSTPIRVPSMRYQSEVVAKLRPMRDLAQIVAAEREARREQFTHYRDQLLTFPERTFAA